MAVYKGNTMENITYLPDLEGAAHAECVSIDAVSGNTILLSLGPKHIPEP